MKVAIDAMGGDDAPASVVEGAVLAYRELGIESLLVGDPERIDGELRRLGAETLPLEKVPSTQVVGMDEPPTVALKEKHDSSIRVAVECVLQEKATGLVSAGNTGAAFTTASYLLKPLKGVLRPGIATSIPTFSGSSVLLDVGANVDCKPVHLLQFGIMGRAYAKHVLGRASPTVGLLNIGGEGSKGNRITKQAYQLFQRSALNFVGNVEGNHLYMGKADVIVCDGFTGNIAIKVSESMGEMLEYMLRGELDRSFRSRLGYRIMQNGFKSFKKRMDYVEYGGAPLLGLNGTCVIAHGRSTPRAIMNAIRVARDTAASQLNARIREDIELNIEAQGVADRGRRLWHHMRSRILHLPEEDGEGGEGEGEGESQP